MFGEIATIFRLEISHKPTFANTTQQVDSCNNKEAIAHCIKRTITPVILSGMRKIRM